MQCGPGGSRTHDQSIMSRPSLSAVLTSEDTGHPRAKRLPYLLAQRGGEPLKGHQGAKRTARMMSRYHGVMTKQTTVRLPQELADQAEAVARVRGCSVNALIVDSLAAEIERVRKDEDFTARARRLLTRDKELLERLAQ